MLDIKIETSQRDAAQLGANMPEVLRGARDAAGEEVLSEVQDHFLELDTRPNKKNWPKSHFWAGIAKRVSSNVTDDSYSVVVADESGAYWRKVKGGAPIVPQGGRKRLAIPAIAEAYAAGTPGAGRVPVELSVFVRRRAVMLGEYEEVASKRKDGKLRKILTRVWYWLVRESNPPVEADAAPDFTALRAMASRAARAYVRAELRRLA